MSRLSRRQHKRKGVREAESERLRLGKIEQAKSFVAMMRLAGETDGFPFEDYKGDYEKVWYDIVLKDGSARIVCYPNAGKFTPWKGRDCRTVDGDNVALFRKSPKQPYEDAS